MNLCKAAFTLLLLAGSAFADDRADRVKLIGVWESPGNGGKNGVWTISAGVDTLHLAYAEGGQKLADFECNLVGRDCKAKAFGHDSTISMYFNGPKLVQMETRGAEVLKRLFSVVGDGDSLQVDLVPIVPDGKPETQQFKRAPLAAAK
jgi:hypothetical protein